MKISTTSKKILAYILSVFVILLLWYLAAKRIGAALILPEPKIVLKKIIENLCSLSCWKNFLYTFLRILISYVISVLIGFILGYFCGINSFFRYFLEIPVEILRTTPVIAVILMALFWFTSNTVPVFVCVLVTMPIMITNVSEGFKITESKSKLLEMSRVFRLSKRQILFNIRLPEAWKSIKSGLTATFGLSWKVVVAGEVICLPSYAVGTQMHKGQIYLETSEVMAQTIILVVICFILEKVISALFSMIGKTKDK